ncbi:ATP-dependent DNA helicase RRM3-like [Arachis ipaensis]|uniref:ATP-dependent DNA helicase RRM3-like n=1 Tax=Arachis ipaensis TaxID=130454 RepID=UPI0007AFA1F6|nr:ATP-dependent DNA helicase RRM3-like [Arachis ipaensis]
MVRPEAVWEKSSTLLSDGILHDHITIFNSPDLTLSESELLQLTLIEIEQILNSNGKTLRDFPTMPYLNMENIHLQRRGIMQNKLILDELFYDRVLLAEQHSQYLAQMTSEQKTIYDKIITAVNSNSGGVFFLYGYGGTGKTFIWKILSAAIRSKGEIVLTVASNGIASLLLPGGRTAHSRFAIPLTPDEYSTCNIKQGSQLVELISETKLIIWDEAPMMNKFCFEALDRTMRDLLRFTNDSSLSLPFGGKTVVFSGDFRQILPVITKGSKQDIVNASINSSYLWHECQILSLT